MFGRVLRPDEFAATASYEAVDPDARLAPWVRRYWSVTFALDEGDVFRTATLDDPFVHLTREVGGISRVRAPGPGNWVTGPETRRRFDVELRGEGSTVGVAFHVGGTLAFSAGRPASVIDASVPAEDWFPGIDADFATLPPTASAAAPLLDAWLLAREPQVDPAYTRFREAVAALDDPDVSSPAQLARRVGCDVRTLQRRFHHYAGIGPKWMLMRARVRDAVGALDRGWDGTMAELAASFGWFDQSHFARDFHAVTGETPSAYRARLAAPRAANPDRS